jgi:hypothetical protein
MSGLGHKREFHTLLMDVRFSAGTGHRSSLAECLLSARSGRHDTEAALESSVTLTGDIQSGDGQTTAC